MRARRAAAWLIDTAPLWLATALVGPLAFIHALMLRQEAEAGIGLFDPAHRDGVARRLLDLDARAIGPALLLVFAWAIVQVTAILAARRTAGKSLLGLGLSAATDPPARGRVLLREMTRFVLLAAVPVAHAVFAFPRLTRQPGSEFFTPGAKPMFQIWSIWTTLIVVGGLMIAAICITLSETILVAADPTARTIGDRLARTRVVRRDG